MKHPLAIAQPRRQAGFHTIGKRDARREKEQLCFLLGVELLLVGWRILQDAKLLKQQKNNCIIEN